MLPRLLAAAAPWVARPRRPVLGHLPLQRTCTCTPTPTPTRRFAALSTPPPCEHVLVPCRSNGAIKIDIFHSPSPSSPVIIYLPSGPVLPDCSNEEARIISVLGASSQATVARINYRASPEHQYPTPYHDALFGYDWVLRNLVGRKPAPSTASRRVQLPRIGVVGELVGGSLATLLALTECRVNESGIGAAAVNNPITDWVLPDDIPISGKLQDPFALGSAPEETSFPADEDVMSLRAPETDDHPLAKERKRKKSVVKKMPPPTAWEIYGDNNIIPTLTISGERDVLFRKAEDYFDRFASPIHFFRSPHGVLVYPESDDALASSSPPTQSIDPLDWEAQMSLNHYNSFEGQPKQAQLPILTRCRTYHRIYPPAGIGLHIPDWYITTGSQSPLLDQAFELTTKIRKVVARQALRDSAPGGAARALWKDKDERARFEALAENKVRSETHKGIGLWSQPDDKSEWKSQVENIGSWMRDTLQV